MMKCSKVQALLSEYVDNALSARDTWEVERHLSVCYECTRLVNELRRTVAILVEAPRYEVSPEFMERLQARISKLEPAPVRQTWGSSLGYLLRPRTLSAWGVGFACVLLLMLWFMPRSTRVSNKPLSLLEGPHVAVRLVQVAKAQNILMAASDPFEDLSAANLAADSSGSSTE
jgi:anti-sigma factor RsiW